MSEAENAGSRRITMEELGELVARAQQGDQTVLPLVRECLERNPQLWEHYGNLAAQTEAAWTKVIANDDLYLAECVVRAAEQLRQELSGPAPTPLERLLIDRIVACWLQVNFADSYAGQFRGDSLRHAEAVQKRLDAAHRRFLAAIRGLAGVRKLIPSSIPVVENTAETPVQEQAAAVDSANGSSKEEIRFSWPRSGCAPATNGDGASLEGFDDLPDHSPHENRIAELLKAFRAGPEGWLAPE